jgi:predicted phosphoribosyltransferase
MTFHDRQDAGQKLAAALLPLFKGELSRGTGPRFAGKGVTDKIVIVGLPRGGVIVAAEIAKALGLPLDIIVPRKIGAEGNPEYAIGAITETGDVIWNEEERRRSRPEYLERKVKEEQAEALRRLKEYRKDRPPRDLKDKTVILVDDGIATGLTMLAAIKTARAEGANRVIVASPVAAADTAKKLKGLVDDLVIISAPTDFGAVGEFYEHFDQTTDEEVRVILRTSEARTKDLLGDPSLRSG